MTRHDKRDLERAKLLAEILKQYRGGMPNRAVGTAAFLFDVPRTRRLYRAIIRELGGTYGTHQ